jgi:hypothetical protein
MRWQQRPHDAWSRQRARVLALLRRLDVPAQAHQGPRHWAALLHERHGAAARPLADLLLSLEASRYGAGAPAQGWRARHRWWASARAAGRMLRANR